ncbi:MAG: hypothetical protein H0T12_07630 [Actinobacteria bacterium]|nr:hypothetical protein [Actinomycetota bacterium]
MSEAESRHRHTAADTYSGVNFFDRVRSVAGAILMASGAASIVGSMLDWVTITPPPKLRPPLREMGMQEVKGSEPFSGIEAGDGWWVAGAGVIMILAAGMLMLRRRSLYAWIALVAAMVIGGITFADFRAIGDLGSGLSRRMDIVGLAKPSLGIALVAASALVGIVASGAGIAATPRTPLPKGQFTYPS